MPGKAGPHCPAGAVTKMSASALVSPATRLVASDLSAMTGTVLIDGWIRSAVIRGGSIELTSSRVLVPV